jgi:hypothetical protein
LLLGVTQRMERNENIIDFLDLISNVMEAYTVALFTVENEKENIIKLFSHRSFSKNIDGECRLFSGEGFVSWVHREQKSVLVNHFERSTTTLKFYTSDEEIKSLVAVPLPDRAGVLYVDSKKSYRFTEEREKICRQMSLTALALLRARQEAAEKKVFENMLSLSGEMDILLGRDQSRDVFLREGLEIISKRLELDFTFFVIPDEIVHYCQPGARKGSFIHRAASPDSFSRDGLLGWSIKNRKQIVRENIPPKTKSYVLNKEEFLGNYSNFVGVPLSLAGSTRHGGAGLIKPSGCRWHSLEVETAGHVIQRFYQKWCAQEKK